MSSTNADSNVRAVLEAIREGDMAVEYTDANSERAWHDGHFAEGRVLELNEEHVIIEAPADDSTGLGTKGMTLELIASFRYQRWVFHADVKWCSPFRVGGEQVMGMCLSNPRAIKNAQRRRFFRVDTAGTDLDPVSLKPVGAVCHAHLSFFEMANQEQVGDGPITGSLVNINGTGIGVNVKGRPNEELSGIPRFDCVIRLPTEHLDIELRGHLLRCEPRQNGSSYLAIKIDFENDRQQKRYVDLICRFAAWCQRNQLKRTRGVY